MNASAVVRIYCTSQDPEYDAPWQAKTPQASTGSGVIIGPRRILTGAHVVANATFVEVQRVEDPTKVAARLVAVCHDADLALLEVDDASFMTDVIPPAFGPVPALRARVSVVGFPVGGQEVSVTEGIVSRIEVQQYSHSRRRLLAITVDAAINSGNSGGPVFVDDKVIGIAFQSMVDAENIGEVVPTVLIERFLRSVDEGKPVSVPALSLRTQVLENEALRRSLGMPAGTTGIRVIAVEHGGACEGHVKVGDALLEVDGHVVANNGTIRYANRFRTQVGALLGHRAVGEPLGLVVWRDGQRLQLQVTLAPLASLVERHRYDRRPDYLVYGGLVFQPLTRDFLTTWDKWWLHAPKDLLDAYWNGSRTAEVEELVVVTQVLADELTMGVSERVNEVVATVNGSVLRNLAHLMELVDAAPDVLVLDTCRGNRIVLETTAVRARHAAVLARYHIPSDRCVGGGLD
jgi:S1-C subfamily serine protease